MQLLKIVDTERGTVYIATDDISSIYYDAEEESNVICMKNRMVFYPEGDINKLVKVLSQTTNSNLLRME